jgi:hypothetical protein
MLDVVSPVDQFIWVKIPPETVNCVLLPQMELGPLMAGVGCGRLLNGWLAVAVQPLASVAVTL